MVMIEAVAIPDSKLCKEITELVRDTEPELLFNHFGSHRPTRAAPNWR
jgi:hypothetical protein